MKPNKSYSIIYNVQRIILLVFYSISMIALFIPLARWINRISPDNLFPFVVVFILYIVLSVILGTFISLVSYIPFNMSSAFDPIKNDIASGEISNKEEFGKRLTVFITDFFNFSFLDIQYALFMMDDLNPISNRENPELIRTVKKHDILNLSKTTEDMFLAGKFTLEKRSCYLYVIPLWFGDRWLGCIGILSFKRINRFFQKILMEFENNFIDDQLMHVL